MARGADDAPRGQHYLAPPLKQAVFDLETFGLDRGWGVLLVGCILVHGEGPEPIMHTFTARESSTWPHKRSDDRELAIKIMDVLRTCHVAYAHNAMNFDMRWLNSLALKYDLEPLNIKIVDPIRIARLKYKIGRNALGSLANFLELSEDKMPLPMDVWRFALLDDDKESWDLLVERCQSDVRILNQVAGRVTRDAGMIDKNGSYWG